MKKTASARARARAALVLFLFRSVCGLLLAYPVARTLGAFVPSTYPVSDALLFAPGGVYLVEALRLGGRAVQASVEGSGLGFVVVAIVATFPFAVALSSLVHPSRSLPSLVKRGAESTPALLALGGAAALAQAVGLAAIAGAVNGVSGAFDSVTDERHADLLVAAFALLACLPLLALGLAHDLARAAVVRHGVRSTHAAAMAFRKLRAATNAVFTAWLAPAVASGALVLLAAWVAGMLDVSRPGAARVWAVAALHQATVLGLVLLRLWWLERALALVDPPAPPDDEPTATVSDLPRASLAGKPARSGAPDDPTPDPAS